MTPLARKLNAVLPLTPEDRADLREAADLISRLALGTGCRCSSCVERRRLVRRLRKIAGPKRAKKAKA